MHREIAQFTELQMKKRNNKSIAIKGRALYPFIIKQQWTNQNCIPNKIKRKALPLTNLQVHEFQSPNNFILFVYIIRCQNIVECLRIYCG